MCALPSGVTVQNPPSGNYPYLAYIKFLLSTSSSYKQQFGIVTNGFSLDTTIDFDKTEEDNVGWFERQKMISGSRLVTLISEIPLDIASSYKGWSVTVSCKYMCEMYTVFSFSPCHGNWAHISTCQG